MTLLQKRIQNLQRKVGAAQTGAFDLATTNIFLNKMHVTIPAQLDFQARKELMQKQLGFTGKDVDGIIGSITVSRLELLVSDVLPTLPMGASLITSKKSLDIIIESEVSSKALYEKKYKSPVLPGESSGITIGIGYDIGHVNLTTFTNDWKGQIPAPSFNLLSAAVGKKQAAASLALTPAVKAITIEWDIALKVFYSASMPVYAKKAKRIYPGLEKLPPDAQGAIVSLVYNRGESLANIDSRLEMRNLVGLIAAGKLKPIANEIRKMKRLWNINTSRGLHIRRDREADLVENADFLMMPNDYVFI